MPVSFFTRASAKNVWKSVTGVSAAGLKRGRGRGTGRILVKDFNKGQEIGKGRKKILFPGLTANHMVSSNLHEIQELGTDEGYEERLNTVRAEMDFNIHRKRRQPPIDRGWSSYKAHGRRAGPPDEYNENVFEGFDSRVLMLKNRLSMTGLLGRTKTIHALVVTGNGNGLAGFATAQGKDGRAVVRHARNRAGQALVSIPRWDNHTVMHDFFSRYYFTTVFVQRKPKGYGIRAHRIIQAICEMFGITDLSANVEGSTSNQVNITKAFFLGLMNQKRYEDMAEEKRLHLVELRDEHHDYPMLLASPKSPIRHDDEIKNTNENIDFTYFINEGKIKQVKAKPNNPFKQTPSWRRHLDKLDYGKNREATKLLLAAKYGDAKVKDIFPYFRSNAESFNKGTGVKENQ